jgi:hypothetical protein
VIDLADASLVLQYYAMVAADLHPTFSQLAAGISEEAAWNAADADGSQQIDLADAALILEQYVKVASRL